MNTERATFEQVHTAIFRYRAEKSAYDFQALIDICEKMGWTIDEFNDVLQEKLTFMTLQGKFL